MNDKAEKFLKEAIDEFFTQNGIKTDENEFRKYLNDINMLNPKANFLNNAKNQFTCFWLVKPY